MKVYLTFFHVDYESTVCLSVHSSKEGAIKRIEESLVSHDSGKQYEFDSEYCTWYLNGYSYSIEEEDLLD